MYLECADKFSFSGCLGRVKFTSSPAGFIWLSGGRGSVKFLVRFLKRGK